MTGRRVARVLLAIRLALSVAMIGASAAGASAAVMESDAALRGVKLFTPGEQERELPLALTTAIALLNEEKTRAEGKLKLAEFMSANPDHPVALEVAGTLLMQEGNFAVAAQSLQRAIMLDRTRNDAVAKLGVILMMQGQIERGEKALVQALRHNANQPLALRYLGWLAEQRGSATDALVYYRSLYQASYTPKDRITDVAFDLARVYNATGHFARTRALLAPLLSKTPPQDPNLTEGVYQLAVAEIELRLNTAAETVAKFASLVPETDPRAGILQAASMRLNRQYDEAERTIEQVIKAEPKFAVTALHQQARIRFEKGDSAAAVASLKQAFDSSEGAQRAFLLREIVAALASTGKGAEAITLLDEYATKYPKVAMIPYLRAELRAQASEPARALSDLQTVIRLDPNFAPAYQLSGILRWKQKELPKAEELLRKAVQLSPRSVAAWEALAAVTHDKSGDRAMLAALREATTVSPTSMELMTQHASVAYSQGAVAEAQKLYERMLAQDESEPDALIGFALTTADLGGDLKTAEAHARRALQAGPKHEAYASDALGWVLLRSGSANRAFPYLQRATKLDPKDGGILFHLGHAYQVAGKEATARTYFQRASRSQLPRHYRTEIGKILK